MSFFLILLLAVTLASTSLVFVAYLKSLFLLYYVLKVWRYSIEYRLKYSDKTARILVFVFTFLSMFAKDFYLHYSLIGHIYHTDEELIFKVFVFSLASIAILSPGLPFINWLYRNDVLRTLVFAGFGFSDLMAVNWVSNRYHEGSMTDLRYLIVMATVPCPPALVAFCKETMNGRWEGAGKVLRDLRNISSLNVAMAGANIWLLDYLRRTENNYALVCHWMVNAFAYSFFFPFKSYQYGLFYEEKLRREGEKLRVTEGEESLENREAKENGKEAKQSRKKKNE